MHNRRSAATRSHLHACTQTDMYKYTRIRIHTSPRPVDVERAEGEELREVEGQRVDGVLGDLFRVLVLVLVDLVDGWTEFVFVHWFWC
jgi:hypothetical protein